MTLAAVAMGLGLLAALTGGLAAPIMQHAPAESEWSGGHRCDFARREGTLTEGPWGHITWSRIVVAPPASAATSLVLGSPPMRWRFPNTTRHELADLLTQLPISESDFAALLETTRVDPAIHGFTMKLDPALLQHIPAPARAALYAKLSQSPINMAQINAFRFWGNSSEAWFDATRLSAESRAAVSPYVYQHGHFLFFADLEPVLQQVGGHAERTELLQNLAAESTLTLSLHVAEGQDIEPLVAYWSTNAHAKALRPLLQSLADTPGGGTIDATHLLPPFARKRLYTYPAQESELGPGASRDCHWTALNFVNDEPDDRYADAAYVENLLATEYVPVTTPRYGDLVLLMSDGEIFHSAVYIADDVLFTKNGSRRTRPWMLLPLCVMKDFYPRSGPIEVIYLRPAKAERGAPPGSAGRRPD